MPVKANAAASTLGVYESYNTGGADNISVFGESWKAQTFTTSATVAHSVWQIKLPLKRVGLPGYIICSLRETLTGADLFSWAVDGDTISSVDYQWISFYSYASLITQANTKFPLEANTQYSIILRAPSATGATYIDWASTAAGGVGGGNEYSSTNSGVTWVDDAPIDAEYEIWGYPSLNIIGANIFKDYLETGDWMILVSTDNILNPYYREGQDPGAYTAIQLVNNAGVVVASSPMKYWERQPIAIYMSAAGSVGQTWAGAYTIRLMDISGSPYNIYTVQASDWRGSISTTKAYLNSWLTLQAIDYQTYYGTTLLVSTWDKGLVLNDIGKVIFSRGIPQITTVVPLMFQTSSGTDTKLVPGNYTRAYELGRSYTVELGPTLSGMLVSAANITTGNTTTNNVKAVGSFLIVAVYLIIAIAATASISAWAGIALGIPIIMLGGYFGIIDLTIIAIIGSMMAFLLIYQWVWGKA